MKINEVIARLEEIRGSIGDVDVCYQSGDVLHGEYSLVDVERVELYGGVVLLVDEDSTRPSLFWVKHRHLTPSEIWRQWNLLTDEEKEEWDRKNKDIAYSC